MAEECLIDDLIEWMRFLDEISVMCKDVLPIAVAIAVAYLLGLLGSGALRFHVFADVVCIRLYRIVIYCNEY